MPQAAPSRWAGASESLQLGMPRAQPAMGLSTDLAMALVPRGLAPVLKSLVRKPRPLADLFCVALLPSTASATRPRERGSAKITGAQTPEPN